MLVGFDRLVGTFIQQRKTIKEQYNDCSPLIHAILDIVKKGTWVGALCPSLGEVMTHLSA